MSKIGQMFNFKGKTTKIIGPEKTEAYKEVYTVILSDQQKNKNLPTHHEDYLGDNELSSKVFMKKNIFLKI